MSKQIVFEHDGKQYTLEYMYRSPLNQALCMG